MAETSRMQGVLTPVIPLVAEWIAETPGTITLGQGVVPYGPPPEAIAELSRFHADPENHKYKAVGGIAPLVALIEEKLRADNGIAVGADARVVVTAGGNMAFLNAILAIGELGDEVILLSPYYFNHHMAVSMVGCRPVVVPTDTRHQPNLDGIAAAITPRTRAVVTVSPNNPTGAVYPRATLKAVNELCAARGLYHIHDEAYEYFTYDGATPFSPASLPGAAAHTISLYSLSKAYGFASWRIGYMVLPAALHLSVKKIQDTNVICPPVISQFAACGALRAGRAYCRENLAPIARARAIFQRGLDELADLCEVPPAEGAFYFFLRVGGALDPLLLVERLVREHNVAAMPGTAFGVADACALRVSYGALDEATAAEGMRRLTRGLRALVG